MRQNSGNWPQTIANKPYQVRFYLDRYRIENDRREFDTTTASIIQKQLRWLLVNKIFKSLKQEMCATGLIHIIYLHTIPAITLIKKQLDIQAK